MARKRLSVFGRSHAQRLLIGAIVVSLGLYALGAAVPLGAFVFYRSTLAGGVAALALLATAAVGSYNDAGYVVVVVVQFLLLAALFSSGGVATFPDPTLSEYLRLLLRLAIVVALLSGTVGYVIGRTLQRAGW